MQSQVQPAFATVSDWVRLSGMRRTATFAAIRDGQLRAVKNGRQTLVDVEKGLAFLNSLPLACGRSSESTAHGAAA